MNEDIMLILVRIIAIITASISSAIAIKINAKRVKSRMEPLDYTEYKQKRKSNYTRNLIIDEHIISKIKENDLYFDENVFKEWVKETFTELQKAWTNKNIEMVRNRLDHNLLEHYKLSLNSNVEKHCRNIIELKQINYVDFSAYSVDEEKELIQVAINVVMIDYTIDELTEKIVNGSKNTKLRTTYKMDFYRKAGSKSDSGENNLKSSILCPNCGAKLEIENKRCKYCNTLVLNGNSEWLLNNVELY